MSAMTVRSVSGASMTRLSHARMSVRGVIWNRFVIGNTGLLLAAWKGLCGTLFNRG
ncbi:hypothetical protein BMS3Bbin10_01423 [bacterium BMS3Bbin10]|nr:hypothetical protein BMS3Bbin10_01423 [bacterium BMS3Bbin10]